MLNPSPLSSGPTSYLPGTGHPPSSSRPSRHSLEGQSVAWALVREGPRMVSSPMLHHNVFTTMSPARSGLGSRLPHWGWALGRPAPSRTGLPAAIGMVFLPVKGSLRRPDCPLTAGAAVLVQWSPKWDIRSLVALPSPAARAAPVPRHRWTPGRSDLVLLRARRFPAAALLPTSCQCSETTVTHPTPPWHI